MRDDINKVTPSNPTIVGGFMYVTYNMLFYVNWCML